MAKTVDIIRRVVDAIDLTFVVKIIVDNGDGTFTLTTCDTLHLQENFSLTIGGNDYTINTVVENESITVTGTVLPAVSEFEIYPAIYFHGTIIKTKEEMEIAKDNEDDVFKITPFIYLKEIIRDRNFRKGDSGSPYERESDLRIFFMTQSRFDDWTTTDHYEKSIDPMLNLVRRFIESAQKEILVGEFENGGDETINHVNFGVYVDSAGHTQSIFVEHLSGVELNITFPFYKEPCIPCS